MRAKILVGLMFFSLLVPKVSLAAGGDVLPELNPLCWRQKDCIEARTKLNVSPGDGGWLQEDPCTGDWGKCLPAGKTNTEIAFGGKKEFSNIGDFLKTNFNLALTIAGILAVIMIIVAGVQWTTSGGNSEMITSSKKRISGALIGLLIAYLSYTILNTINPALVNLRLPQTFMIRPNNLVIGNYCVDLEKLIKVAPVAKETDTPKEGDFIDPFKEIEPEKLCSDEASTFKSLNPLREDKTKCGQKYLVKDGGGATCMGSVCDEGYVCDNKCVLFGAGKEGGIGGTIVWSNNQWTENIYLYATCGPNNYELEKINTEHDTKDYMFSPETIQKAVASCGSESAVDGFFFAVEIKDNWGGFNDIWYGGTSLCQNITGAPSCGFIGANHYNQSYVDLSTLALAQNGQLIPYVNAKKGFLCNLNVGTSAMPQVGKGVLQTIAAGVIEVHFPKLKKAAENTFLSGEQLVSGFGGNYSCPAYDRADGAFAAKLNKVKCKCHPEKCK